VIPETATLDGTIRTVTARVRSDAHAGVRRIAEHVAAAHDMVAEVTIEDGYPVTVNDGPAAEEVLDTARWLVRDDLTVVMPTPVMGAEDFSYILNQVPGAMAFLGTRPPGVSPPTSRPTIPTAWCSTRAPSPRAWPSTPPGPAPLGSRGVRRP
jgi:hippurate hydrolase